MKGAIFSFTLFLRVLLGKDGGGRRSESVQTIEKQ